MNIRTLRAAALFSLLLVPAALLGPVAPVQADCDFGGECRATSGNMNVTLTRMRYCTELNIFNKCKTWAFASGFGSYFTQLFLDLGDTSDAALVASELAFGNVVSNIYIAKGACSITRSRSQFLT